MAQRTSARSMGAGAGAAVLVPEAAPSPPS